jgi:hypothetical protein
MNSIPELIWHDVRDWGLEGRAWGDHARLRYFDRLPAAAEARAKTTVETMGISSAWDMSRCSAGMMACFDTNASEIRVRYRLLKEELAMPHMPATGVSGVDLYSRDQQGEWRYVQGILSNSREVEGSLIAGLSRVEQHYALYNGVESLEIGVPVEASFAGIAPRPNPVVFYGTSITQGGVASRPGMAHVSILGRRLDRPVLNLGFSGTGRMDTAIGEYLAQVDAAAFVIECSANMNADLIRERCVPFVKALRAAWSTTPIIHLYGTDSEGSTDGSHASDLGFMRLADAMEPVLRAALKNG